MQLIRELEATTDPTDELLSAIIDEIKSSYAIDADVSARLATIYAQSGSVISFPQEMCIDVASTGGPSSLSTLIIPLFFSSVRLPVPKLGVPGRPAGGIDSLVQLPGYRYSLSSDEVYRVMAECGYAHFLANDSFAPLDRRIFDLRKQNEAMNVPTLTAASLLAKKIAVGIRIAGLDIRVAPHGNFGGTWEEAKDNAIFFKNVARKLDINAITILSDAKFPFQPYIGRKEALLALWKIFECDACDWLTYHYNQCKTIAIACVPMEYKKQINSLSVDNIKQAFDMNLAAQGARYSSFCEIAQNTYELHSEFVLATHDGFVAYSLNSLREVLVKEQQLSGLPFADPVGVRLLKRSGEWVEQGAPVLSFRHEALDSGDLRKNLSKCVCIDTWKISTSDLEGV